MTLLSNRGIARLREQGAIVIEPHDERAIANCSYDLTLGGEIARYRDLEFFEPGVHDPKDLFRIHTSEQSARGERAFHIGPGERVLAHSREIAGGRMVVCPACRGSTDSDEPACAECDGFGRLAVTTQLHATSTAARIGLQVCGCAGWGDVGFVSPWVFEITNLSPVALWIPVGAVIAQVSFHQVEPPLAGTTYDQIGSYQTTADVAEIRKTWRLADGLPKRLKVRS